MLNITITEQTPHNMLRAIRAACNELLGDMPAERQILNEVVPHLKNDEKAAQHVTEANRLNAAANSELDKAAASLSAHNAQGGPVDAGQFYRVGEQPSEQTVLAAAFDKAVQTVGPEIVAATLSTETDSAGAEWNPELHASTKAKNQDGTWKKRRGAGKAEDAPEQPAAAPSLPPLPPTPPAPAAPLVTMNDIYALITNGKAVLNDVIAGAQAMGFADVGAFSRDATPEQRAQLLAQLTKEVA